MDGPLRRLTNAFATAVLILRRLALSFRYNWGIGLLSLVLAVSLWVYVTDKNNPQRTIRVPGTVPIEVVNVPPDQAVFPPIDQSVTVRARAAANVLDGLQAGDFRATINLADVRSPQATVKVDVVPKDPHVEVVDVTPSEVTVQLENVTSRSVPVRAHLVGAPPRGYQAGTPAVEPANVSVTGAETLVGRVAAVEADVNLTGARSNVQQTVLLQARDGLGGNIQGVRVDPASAVVRVDITQLEFSGPLIVRPNVSGTPAAGYNVTAIRVDPAIVIVSGPADVFQNIDPVAGLATEAVSIDGATSDVIRTVALRLPSGATTQQPTVTVRVTIAPAQGSFSFSVPVRTANLRAGLTAELGTAAVQVVLSGAVPDLAKVTVAQIVATVDLSGHDAGEFDLPVQVQAPPGATVASVAPDRVHVTLRQP